MNQNLDAEQFARLFRTNIGDFDDDVRQFIQRSNFRHAKLNPAQRDDTILSILKRIDSGGLTQVGQQGLERWEKGWSENVDRFVESGYDLESLTPKYVRPNQPLRLDRDYVAAEDAYFELNFFTVLRLWLFKKYLSQCEGIYEFGCGTGYNLPILAKLFPEKKLFGLDWSTNAVHLVNLIGQKHCKNVAGRLFDMFNPDPSLEIAPRSAVVTIGSLEQLGANHQAFVEFLLNKAPSLCVHVEPIVELYDENNLVDYLAIRFHETRHYLVGFLPYLQQLDRDGRIWLQAQNRLCFGSLFHDGWSVLVWKPRV